LVTTSLARPAAAFSVAVQPDGKLAVAGNAKVDGGWDFALARYNSNGTLDTSFGTGGRVLTAFADTSGVSVAGGFSIAVQPDAKLVGAGEAQINGRFDFALVRYNSNGSLDATFGTGGKVTTDFASSDDAAESMALQTDGRIVAAGFSGVAGAYNFALARYNSNGTL